MSDALEHLDLGSLDIAAQRRADVLRLFPEAATEGGKPDFDRLKLVLGESVDVGRERYGMNWPGKADCLKTIQAPSMATLRPCPEESMSFDTTGSLIIEGDNLEVLKLLQRAYLGKVKMIYIDPPYNTGNDFIYPDNFSESLQTYLEYTGKVDAAGRKFGTNADTAGLTVYSVAGGLLFVCLERALALELIRAIADQKPERVVCLDAGFTGNDQLKANAVQIFKTKGVTSFKTV